MKLTKDDFQEPHGFSVDEVNQILKNQEDAEKWNRSWSNPMNYQYAEVQKAFQTVERLKKRIEEINDEFADSTQEFMQNKVFIIELQKILDGKK